MAFAEAAAYALAILLRKNMSIEQSIPLENKGFKCGYPQILNRQISQFISSRVNTKRIHLMKKALKKIEPRSTVKADTELGKRIRLRRVEQKISQSELADKLGVSFQQVQKYEKGVNRVSTANVYHDAASAPKMHLRPE